jgi:hypothetical protein
MDGAFTTHERLNMSAFQLKISGKERRFGKMTWRVY